MAKLNITYAILFTFTLLLPTQINVNASKQSDELEVDNICLNNQKLAKIHFYIHVAFGSPNATMHEVAHAAVSTDARFSFGKIYVFDLPITVGPGPDSGELGKAQGIGTSADMETTAMAESFNVVFTSGEYNGSILGLAGRNSGLDRQRHLAIVGGTGFFRFTRGYVVTTTYSSRVTEDSVLYSVLDYTIYTTFCPIM